MERVLSIVAATGTLLVIGLLTNLAVVSNKTSHGKEATSPDTCSTPKCYEAGTRLRNNLDTKVEPCDNFYEFACGGYMKSTPIPDDSVTTQPFFALHEKVQDSLKNLLEEPIHRNEPKPFTLAKFMYRACMNTTRLEELGLEPLREILKEFGGWPVLEGDNWNGDQFDWLEGVFTCRKNGFKTDMFMDLQLSADWKDSNKWTLMLTQPSFRLPREMLENGIRSPDVKAYLKYMVNVAVLLGADKRQAELDLEESVKFEIELTKISLPAEDRQNYTLLYNPMTVSELNARYPSINWNEYVEHILGSTVRIGVNEKIIVQEPNFISALENLLRDTPKRVLANYLGWRVVAQSTEYMTKSLRDTELQYLFSLSNTKPSETPRWKDCMRIVSDASLSVGINGLYVRKYFKEEARQSVSEIVTDIWNELKRIVTQADWMDDETRSRAMDKVLSIYSHIAYPVELLDDNKLNEVFAPLEVSSNDLLGNIRNVSAYDLDTTYQMLMKPVNKTGWLTHEISTTINALYVANDNSIQIPAGILQIPFFDHELPRYVNYAAIGYLVGHEVTHSFDAEGRQFDKDGNLIDWWTRETAQKYTNKAQCMIDQYSNYTVEAAESNVNGKLTLSENIADNGGLKEAYYAYKAWVRRNGPEQKLPGLEYEPEQLFWINYANVWCNKYRPDAAVYELDETDEHSPGRYRVIGTVSNLPEFAEDFNCPLGSNMNPVKKCSVI